MGLYDDIFTKRVDEDDFGMVKRGVVMTKRYFFTFFRAARSNGVSVNDLLNTAVSLAAEALRKG